MFHENCIYVWIIVSTFGIMQRLVDYFLVIGYDYDKESM